MRKGQLDWTKIATSVIALLALVLSLFSYLSTTEESVRKRELNKAVNILFLRAYLYWENYYLLLGYHGQRKLEHADSNLFYALKINCLPLIEALDRGIALGFRKYLIKTREEWAMYTDFNAALIENSISEPEKRSREDWMQKRIVNGLSLVLKACLKYEKDLIEKKEREQLKKKIDIAIEVTT
jgi:hypothetical protein